MTGRLTPTLTLASLPEGIRLRRLKGEDCLDQLTGMLHRAFSRLGDMGIPCSCVSQSSEVTRQRVARGDCFVAVAGERIVGTITLYAPDAGADSKYYRDIRVASVRQLGVDPGFQGEGVGTALLKFAENWARRHGYARLALDTPEPADHLIGYYHRLGFCVVETLQISARPYRSVVLAKVLCHDTASYRRSRCPPGRRQAFAPAQTTNRIIHRKAGTMRWVNAITNGFHARW